MMKNFEYVRPTNLDDALAVLEEKENVFLLAGGTDLLVRMKYDLIKPSCIIDLKNISSLRTFEKRETWVFGALTSIRHIEISEALRDKMPFLCQAASSLGSVQIRNRGTLGGNLCNASPAADMATMLLAMDSKVKTVSRNGDNVVPLEDFFTGPNNTILNKGEILTEIIVPEDIERFEGLYLKFGPRKAMDIGIVNVALLLDVDSKTKICRSARIALGAVAPTPIRAKQAEALLSGKNLAPGLISEAAETASSETNPISDFRASADYRRELVKALIKKGITSVLNR